MDEEAFPLHRGAQPLAIRARFGRATRVRGTSAIREVVELARHRDRLAGRAIEERHVDGATAIVARAAGGVGDELAALGRRDVPERLRDAPRPIRVEDHEPEALRRERAVHAYERFGRGALQERARGRIQLSAGDVVGRRVADVEADRRIERDDLHERGRARGAIVDRRAVARSCARRHDEYEEPSSKPSPHAEPPPPSSAKSGPRSTTSSQSAVSESVAGCALIESATCMPTCVPSAAILSFPNGTQTSACETAPRENLTRLPATKSGTSLAPSPDPAAGPNDVLGPKDALSTTWIVDGASARISAFRLSFTSQKT
jgi:hypothetical protein